MRSKLDQAKRQADDLLAEMREVQIEMAKIETCAAVVIEELKQTFRNQLAPLQNRLKELDTAIVKLEKAHKADMFSGESCRVDLPHGALLFEVSRKVKKARGLTWEKLELAGYPDGVRIEKSVDWDRLETWPEEKLIAVGTERVRKEVFSYEVKETGA